MRKKLDQNLTVTSGEGATIRLHTPHELADLRSFERAMKEFNDGRFADARELFERLVQSSDTGLADVARQRVRMCERRIADANR